MEQDVKKRKAAERAYEIIEQKPYAYQLKKDKKIDIPCSFEILDNVVRFVFPKGYNKNLELIISSISR